MSRHKRAAAGVSGSCLSVALIGGRGVPARYGGFETLMEELGVRLERHGFAVTVYCRSHYTPREQTSHRGMELVVLPTIRTKHLDTPVHTLLSCLHAAGRGFDAALVVNAANAVFVPLLKLRHIPVALNVDGIERQRRKWGVLARSVYAMSERLAVTLADVLVTDAEVIRDYYRERYCADSTLLRYGVDPRPLPPGETLARLGLEPRRYFLYVSRFEPENNPHRVAAAYRAVGGDLPLVMVGGAPYASAFIRGFTEGADPRLRFPGPIYGDGYRELLSHALAYVQATEVGGTHPALVEAMGYGNCVVVNDTPENREIAGDTAIYFQAAHPDTLAAALDRVLTARDEADARGVAAADRARRRYSWERISAAYAETLERLAAGY